MKKLLYSFLAIIGISTFLFFGSLYKNSNTGYFGADYRTSRTVLTTSTPHYIFDQSGASVNIKSTSGYFHGLVMDNASGSKLFIQFFNATSSVPNGTTPILSFPLNSGNQMIVDASYFRYLGHYFPTGIEMVVSDTYRTSTPSSNYTGINGMVQYD